MNALLCVLFPSILYGQILIGTGTSRYETVFTLTAKKATRATLTLYTDKGEPMDASFVDERGSIARSGSSFEVFLTPERPVKIKLALMPGEASEDVAVKTGWATFRSSEEIDVSAVVRIMTPNGTLMQRHVLPSERSPVAALYRLRLRAVALALRGAPAVINRRYRLRALHQSSHDFRWPLPHQLPLFEFVPQRFV